MAAGALNPLQFSTISRLTMAAVAFTAWP